MNAYKTTHGSFVIEKQYNHSVQKLFSFFSDREKKKTWFLGSDTKDCISYELDFRVEGKESSRWKYTGNGPLAEGTVLGNDTVYLDIVENVRIVIAYSMLANNKRFSSSLLTFEFTGTDKTAKIKATEQGAYFENSDGSEMRKDGWTVLLNRLSGVLDND